MCIRKEGVTCPQNTEPISPKFVKPFGQNMFNIADMYGGNP